MDYRVESNQGGADGCINFNDEDNTGLAECLTESALPGVYEQFCDEVSLADFLVIAAEAVMGRTATSHRNFNYYARDTLANAL